MKNRLIAILLTVIICLSIVPAASAAQPKLVALTFDDGPGPYTERLLNGLMDKEVHATFFCLGERASKYPDLIQRMIREGHQVANHSYSHPNLNVLSVQDATAEISRADNVLNSIIGGSESFQLRPPYGNVSLALRSQMVSSAINWSVDTIDWQLLNAEAVKNKILTDTYDGSIVLMHDIHPTTVEAVLSAIDTLKARGYEFVTVKELFRRRNVNMESGQIYMDCRSNGIDLGAVQSPLMHITRSDEQIELTFESLDGAPIYYTLDGSDVGYDSILYNGSVVVQLPCHIRAVAAWDLNGDRSREVSGSYSLPPAAEPIVYAENGKLIISPGTAGETVYVSVNQGAWQSWEEAEIIPGSWISCYEDGESVQPSAVQTVFYTDNGNLTVDLDHTAWYYHAVDHGITMGYFKGSGNGHYDSEGKLTRAMLAALLYRYAGEPSISDSHLFTDVPDNAYYGDALSWGYSLGILQGIGNGQYEPDRLVTRQELAKVLAAYLLLDEPSVELSYLDINEISHWALNSVGAVTEHGYMIGSSGYFRPKASVTRAEFATLLMRMDEKNLF